MMEPATLSSAGPAAPRPRAGAHRAVGSIRCSGVDVVLQNVPVPVTFTFEERLDPKPLLTALESALESFPIFSGRLCIRNEELYIDCNHGGVSSSVVHRKEDFLTVLEAFGRGKILDLCDIIDPKACLEKGAPLLTVRINQPRDRGTIVGICWHHSVGDMTTLMALVKAWAATSRGEPFEAPVFSVDRHETFMEASRGRGSSTPGIRRLGLFELVRFAGYVAFQAKQQEILRFYFSEAELEAMRDAQGQRAGIRLTRNAALCGHLASMIFPLDPKKRHHDLAMAVDWRSRLGLSPHLLGNFIGGLLVRVEGVPEAHEIARDVHHVVERSVERHLNYDASHALLEANGGARAARRHVSLGIDPMRGTLLITNWSRFGVNEVVFQGVRCSGFSGGGRPPFPWLSSITEGPHNRGLAYGVSLPPGMARALRSPDSVARMHAHRPSDDSLPEEISRLSSWL